MEEHGRDEFARALREAVNESPLKQAAIAAELSVDPSQVSRWVRGKSIPQSDTVDALERILHADLRSAFDEATAHPELYVSAPITGLTPDRLRTHHDQVADVVEHVEAHVVSIYWPGRAITDTTDLTAADLATERNMRAIAHCSAFLFLQFEEIIAPSSALVELGIALGRRIKTTIFIRSGLRQPYMLNGFGAVAASLNFLPTARVYYVDSAEEACHTIDKDGRELLGLA